MPFIGVDGLVNGLVCLNIDSNDDSYSNDDFDSNDNSKYVPVPLTKVHVEARVVNFVSQVTVTQNYINKEKNPIEAIYFFPVEEEAAVIDFTAELEGRTVKTVVKEKEEAKQEYHEAVRDRKTAFLLEETKPDIFQIQVGHLSPGSGCTISITYLSELPVEDGKTRLTVPTTIAPRYVPRDDKSEASGKIASIEYDYKTPANLTFKLETIMKTKIKGIENPSHNVVSKIESEADNNNFFIGETQFEGSTSDMDRDIVVLIKTEEPNQPKIVLEKNEEGATVGMLSFVPSFELKDITAEIIFLVDCSGSMSGQSINLAKEALHLFLHSLPIDCYFNIVCFGESFESLFPKSMKYDDYTLDVAKRLVANLSANLGGTEILQPLEHIFNQTSIPGNLRQVFVLTDGEVSNSSQCINCVKKNNNTSRVFTLGIGSSTDRHLVKGMARAGQGTAVFATYGEKIAPKVLKQLKNSLQPCINKVKINWGDGVQQGNIKWQKPVIETTKTLMGYGKHKAGAAGLSEEKSAINNQAPNIVPAIYDGSRLLVYKQFMDGKYPENVTVTADTPDGALDLVLPIDENNILEGNLVHQMFARKLIQDLEEGGDDLDQYYEVRTEFIKSKIVELGIKYKLASKCTSFVGVDEKQGKESQVMMTRQIKNQVAHGYGGYGYGYGGQRFTQYAGGPMTGGTLRSSPGDMDGGYGFGGVSLGGVSMPGGILMSETRRAFGNAAVPIIRESSRRKGKEQASKKRQIQADLLMDDDDPTLNHPALDLDDSDADGDWTPLKEKEGSKLHRKERIDSSDEEFNEFESLKNKKRAYPEPDKTNNKRPAPDTQPDQEIIPGDGEDFKVGDFLVLKGEGSDPYSALWRVDGKTLIQKYECTEKANNKYKNVCTYSGWTASTRHKYQSVAVKMVKQSAKETVVIRLGADAPAPAPAPADSKPPDSPKSPLKPANNEYFVKRKRSATDLSNNEKLIQLTSLQIANGSFKWGDIIEKVSNKSLVDIEAAAAMNGVENDVWLTAVVVMVIETQFDDDKESWGMIVEKAKKWLNKIGNSWDCLFSKVKEFVI